MPAMAVRGAGLVEGRSICGAGSEWIVAVSANVTFNLCLQECCLFFVRADDEDGVISGDGAYDFGPIFVIDSGGDGLRASGGGHKDEEVNGLTDFQAEALEDFANLRERVLIRVSVRGERVAFRTLVQAKFVDVAGQGGLRDVKSATCEFAA
jgi:hypothetical protein